MATYWKVFDRNGVSVGTVATDSLTDAIDLALHSSFGNDVAGIQFWKETDD
jgi:hypothetical protein